MRDVWNVRAKPMRATSMARRRVTSNPFKTMLPESIGMSRDRHPRSVDLPDPVRPNQPDDLAGTDVEVHVTNGVDAAESLLQGPGLQQPGRHRRHALRQGGGYASAALLAATAAVAPVSACAPSGPP